MPRSEPEGPSKLHFMLCCPECVQHWALWHHLSQNQELCLGYHPATHKTFLLVPAYWVSNRNPHILAGALREGMEPGPPEQCWHHEGLWSTGTRARLGHLWLQQGLS